MIERGTLPRLLSWSDGPATSLARHQVLFGTTSTLKAFDELERSGLLGRGGAGFETVRKVALIKAQRASRKVVVVNAMEGEPASRKDFRLLVQNPHLVLEGAEQLAYMVGAVQIVVCIARDNTRAVQSVSQAIHERQRRSLRTPEISLQTPPGRYVAGEESALIHWLNDNESLPQFRPERPSILRIRRHPVLVDNAETCANVALISRYGAEWFRSLGTPAHPGSTLVSISGAVDSPKVIEVALGMPIREMLRAAGADLDPQALVLGGYGGSFVGPDVLSAPYSNDGLAPYGATVGAGIIVVLPKDRCGLFETYRIVRWMAHESARQCGPCAFGLPALADDLSLLVRGGAAAQGALERLQRRSNEIAGHGACRHPDGVIRLVRSALDVLHPDLEHHLRFGPCEHVGKPALCIVPALEHEEALEWS
jgi:NADH:ubiquinone oxidoreductase subunit F (NADH-binding)